MRRFNIGIRDPREAIGEEIILDGRKLNIVGVMKDFHYGKVDNLLEPVAFIFWTPEDRAIINTKIQSNDLPATVAKIESIWNKIDPIHPFYAEFHEEAIEDAYSEYSSMIKIIGFLSFLAISIASIGLFGMVVFTTETRLKEISIRKVLGSSSRNIVYLLSRDFLLMFLISAAIALPITYFFFKEKILTNFPYHTPVQVAELFAGLLVVLLVALMMIGWQTMKAVRSNPSEVLKSE